jgi:hypothetical protein
MPLPLSQPVLPLWGEVQVALFYEGLLFWIPQEMVICCGFGPGNFCGAGGYHYPSERTKWF